MAFVCQPLTLLEVWKNMCTSVDNYETCRDDLILYVTVFELLYNSVVCRQLIFTQILPHLVGV